MAEKPKKTGQKTGSTLTATAIATLAGCSRTLVSRLLSRGFSVEEIVERVRQRRERLETRLAATANPPEGDHVNGQPAGMEFPTIPVPSFAESEKRKEFYLSEIRRAEAAKLHSQLIPIEPARAIIFAASTYLMNRLRDLPGEVTDELGAVGAKVLDLRLQAMTQEARYVMLWECQRHGVPPPPEPSPVLRKRLAYYERFAKDSTEIEIIPAGERMENARWLKAHPSVTEQEWFQIKAKKKAWDERMLQLLAERSSWDLPPEPPPPPPELPEEPEGA
jgi:hypothetical protein